LGHGTTFTIYLPAAKANAELPPLLGNSPLLCKLAPPRSCHILYLDDDAAVRAVTAQIFAKQGYRITCFATGQAALSALREQPFEFDVVITDYNMPEMHGLEVAREVRAIRQDVPIIMTTGYIDEVLKASAREYGVHELIGKPFSMYQMCATVNQLLKPVADEVVPLDESAS
jgi:CheY-like chemotaxis protein